MKSLLSGLIGAVIATLLSVFYLYFTERIRRRSDVMLETIEWLDSIYGRLNAMHVHKDACYTKKKIGLTEDEYRIMSREVRTMLISSTIHAKVSLVYGEGDELQKLNALRGELTKIAEVLWTANENTWSDSNKKILEGFNNVIDPLRKSIERRFLDGTKIKFIIWDFLKIKVI